MLLMALSNPSVARAEHKIFYSGSLAGNKVVIKVNGHSRSMARGQTSKDGIKVLSYNRNEVLVRVHGKRYRYKKKSKTGIQLLDKITIPYTFVPINLQPIKRKKKPDVYPREEK